MDTRQLKCFLKIIETGSISRAAISLSISQPSLSQQLLRLEDELEVKLFHRGARGVTITEAGRIFEEHARYMLQSSTQVLENLRGLKASARGEVVLAAPRGVLQRIGVPLFEAAWRDAPEVSMRIGEGITPNIFSWVEEGKIDLGILYDLGPWPNLTIRPLAEEELFLIGPPGSLSGEHNGNIPLASLRNYPLVLPGFPHALRQLLDREAARLGFVLKVAHEVEVLELIGTLVARGHGRSILPWAIIADDVAAGNLEYRRIGNGVLKRKLCLVRNPARTLKHASVVAEDLVTKVMLEMIRSGAWHAEPAPLQKVQP